MIIRLKKLIIDTFLYKRSRITKDERDEEIVIYFNSSISSKYQVEQWIPIINLLNKYVKVAYVVRRKSAYDWLIANTNNSVYFTHTHKDLMELYENNNFKVILYVNNGVHNFQSLAYRNALHIHINHGESEKISTISNQIRAYNYIFIVANLAFDKYRLNLLECDTTKFIKIGRPQLEHIPKINLDLPKDNKVVLYAPTWEGTHESMNYSSLKDFGLFIVDKLLNDTDYIVLYKPHPNTGYNDKEIKKINQQIINKLNKHNRGSVFLSENILSLYEYVDIAIFDNSAVAVDYLAFNKPMLMTDYFFRVKDRQNLPIIKNAAVMLDKSNIDNILKIVKKELKNDSKKEIRVKIKEYVLGNYNYSKQESTKRFISTVLDMSKKRDRLLKELREKNERFNY